MERFGALFLRVLTVSAGCSAVLAPLLLCARWLRQKIAARSFYVLFLLLALRLVLPVELRLPVPAVELPAPDLTVPVPAAPVPAPSPTVRPDLDLPVVQAPAAPRPVKQVPVHHILGVAWAVGALSCAVFSAGSCLLARKKLLGRSWPAVEDESALLEHLRQELGVRRPVSLRRSGAAPGPLALGLFRPVIVLPGDGGPAEELVLRHELTHIRRWDVAYKLVLSLACWVNWFNPLVWLMDRAAGRNLELCCDDEVTRDLPEGERRRYGGLLLNAAAVRSIPFSTCFSGGKTQMKERLLNLFTHKRNSVALVCLVLTAALLAGGLVACEQTPAGETPSSPDAEPVGADPTPPGSAGGAPYFPEEHEVTPENQARRDLYQVYFAQHYENARSSVVLADLTGDGLEEMLLLTISTRNDAIAELSSVTAGNFSYGEWKVFGVKDGAVAEYPALSAVSSSHAGWGYQYLIDLTDEPGWAVLDFRPYTGQGQAAYSYSVSVLDEAAGTWLSLDGGEVHFHIIPEDADSASLIMGEDVWEDSSVEEVEQLLSRVQAYRDYGAPLLVYNEPYGGTTGGPEFDFQWLVPAGAFDGTGGVYKTGDGVVPNVGAASDIPVEFPLPNPPATPEEALELLNASAQAADGTFIFRIPNYDGDWNVHIAGRMRMGGEESDDYMSVHYLEDEEWMPGRRYCVETNGAYFDDLTLTATVTCHDGTHAEHTICLEGTDEHALVHHEEHHDTVQTPAPTTTYTPGTHHPETHHSEYH